MRWTLDASRTKRHMLAVVGVCSPILQGWALFRKGQDARSRAFNSAQPVQPTPAQPTQTAHPAQPAPACNVCNLGNLCMFNVSLRFSAKCSHMLPDLASIPLITWTLHWQGPRSLTTLKLCKTLASWTKQHYLDLAFVRAKKFNYLKTFRNRH